VKQILQSLPDVFKAHKIDSGVLSIFSPPSLRVDVTAFTTVFYLFILNLKNKTTFYFRIQIPITHLLLNHYSHGVGPPLLVFFYYFSFHNSSFIFFILIKYYFFTNIILYLSSHFLQNFNTISNKRQKDER
jgi:hypothetical protein